MNQIECRFRVHLRATRVSYVRSLQSTCAVLMWLTPEIAPLHVHLQTYGIPLTSEPAVLQITRAGMLRLHLCRFRVRLHATRVSYVWSLQSTCAVLMWLTPEIAPLYVHLQTYGIPLTSEPAVLQITRAGMLRLHLCRFRVHLHATRVSYVRSLQSTCAVLMWLTPEIAPLHVHLQTYGIPFTSEPAVLQITRDRGDASLAFVPLPRASARYSRELRAVTAKHMRGAHVADARNRPAACAFADIRHTTYVRARSAADST